MKRTIVCLCGSTRYYEEFQAANFRETMAGKVVLSVGFYPCAAAKTHGEDIGITPNEKESLDRLHLDKIDLADEILVLNSDGYIGASTYGEIRHAIRTRKLVRWLEPKVTRDGQSMFVEEFEAYINNCDYRAIARVLGLEMI